MSSPVLDAALALNILADLYFRFQQAGVKLTPENLRDHIAALEARAAANDAALGIDVPDGPAV